MKHGAIFRFVRRFACLLLTAFILNPGAVAEEPGLSRTAFQNLHDRLSPERGKKWRLLPWNTSILSAARQAAKQERPVYMIVRSGHPLGAV